MSPNHQNVDMQGTDDVMAGVKVDPLLARWEMGAPRQKWRVVRIGILEVLWGVQLEVFLNESLYFGN
jgi:hypothetical protein